MQWIGHGELRDEIDERIKAKGLTDAVEMVGLTSEVPQYLCRSTYFLMPSLFEGLSLALAEAQAAGLDCFVSDTCSRLSDCGRCVYIPVDYTPQQWAKIICEHIASQKKLEINRESMQKFDIEYMAQRLEKIYEGNKC